MRAEELRLPVGSETLMYLEKVRTNFTENLSSLLSVIEVEIDMWSAAAGTDDILRNL
jgi:hypothetical protein